MIRKLITKRELPKPFGFAESEVTRLGQTYVRNINICQATLNGPVGIKDNAKICEDMAAVPDEQIWWHFDCRGLLGASFNIITNGEVWYPVNRRSGRITTKMNPKKSLDLSAMSYNDRDFLVKIIEDYASEL